MAVNGQLPAIQVINASGPIVGAKLANELLSYNRDMGTLTWKISTGRVAAGEEAGFVNGANGYKYLGIKGRHYLFHRVAWLLANGEWPAQQIDHINGDKTDNRLVNLRLATCSQNHANVGPSAVNTSGFKGVARCRKRWRAAIQHAGKTRHIGVFDAPEQAHAAYIAAAQNLFGDFARAA